MPKESYADPSQLKPIANSEMPLPFPTPTAFLKLADRIW